MKLSLPLLLILLISAFTLRSQDITPDTAVLTGKLPNGLSYYIRENKVPEKQAFLRLVIRAGAVDEDDNQKGMARFIEYLCYEGTASFPKSNLDDFFEKIKYQHGHDRSTGARQDYTVLEIPVPADDPALLQTALKVMSEWAHKLDFNQKNISGVRDSLLSQLRTGLKSGMKVFEMHNQKLYYGSRYADRNVFGDTSSLLNMNNDALMRFYNDWYRPDMMAIIAVGDFAKSVMEQMLRQYLGGIPIHDRPRARETFNIPRHEDVLVSVASSPGLKNDAFSIVIKIPDYKAGSAEAYREDVLRSIYTSMLNERLQDLSRTPDPPFLNARCFEGDFAGETRAFSVTVNTKPGGFRKSFEAVLYEINRAHRLGFLETELRRTKDRMNDFAEKSYQERDKRDSRSFMEDYTMNFLKQEPMIDISTERQLIREIIGQVSLEQVNAISEIFFGKGSTVVTLSLAETDGQALPAEAEVRDMYIRAGQQKAEPWVDIIGNRQLVQNPPVPGRVFSEKKNEILGTITWKMENGMTIILKPTKFKDDEIIMRAFAPGGTSLASDEDVMSASLSSNIVLESGLGDLSPVQLGKLLSGKSIRANPMITDLWHMFSGKSTPQDLETMLQLTYLFFTVPRFEPSGLQSAVNRMENRFKARLNDPESAFNDTVSMVLAAYHKRIKPITGQRLQEVTLEKARLAYTSRFSDASAFTFVFVGNINPETTKKLAETYLGSLPSKDYPPKWKDNGIRLPKQRMERHLAGGRESMSHVKLIFTGDFDYSPKNKYLFNSLTEILKIRLIEKFRIEHPKSNPPRIAGNCVRYPAPEYTISFDFNCPPSEIGARVNQALEVVKTLKDAPDPKATVSVSKIQLEQYRSGLEKNEVWLENITNYLMNGDDPGLIPDYEQYIRKLSAAALQDAARKYLDTSRLIKIISHPN